MRLDYELVRALKCAELQQKGFTLRPGSRVEHMCHDIVPIQSLLPKEMLALIKPSRFNIFKNVTNLKTFVVDLLEKLVESTDNELDDRALQIVKNGLDIE